MTYAAIVCCRAADELMLPIFIKQWRVIYPAVELWLANDVDDPVTGLYGLQETSPVKWGRGVGGQIVSAMLATGADVCAKVDADGWHREPYLFTPFDRDEVMASGIAWSQEPGRFLGIGYAVRREVLARLELTSSCADWWGRQEDVAICHGVRRIFPNGVFLYPTEVCRRADTQPKTARLVHCGIHGRNENGRLLAHAEMLKLANDLPPIEVGVSVWVGLSVMPGRIASAKKVIAGLLGNTVPPAGIVVSIPHVLKRTGQSYDESAVKDLACMDDRVQVVRCVDRGPITKYLELVRSVKNSGDLCLVVDDDISYSSQLIERMAAEWMARSAKVLANSLLATAGYEVPEAWAGVAFTRGAVDLSRFEKYIDWTEKFSEAYLADDALMAFFFDYYHVKVLRSLAPVFAAPTAVNFDGAALCNVGDGHLLRYRRVLQELRESRLELEG
jgi:hypothetical protein